jgi:hypothetical protein
MARWASQRLQGWITSGIFRKRVMNQVAKSGLTVAAMSPLGKRGGTTFRAKPLSGNTFFGLSTIAVDKPVYTL